MNSNQIEKYLEAPHLINSQDTMLLKKSVMDFPYVGVFQMLYVKGLQNTQSAYYGEALQRAALVVNDRSELYRILHNTAPESIVTKADAPAFEDSCATNKQEITENTIAEPPLFNDSGAEENKETKPMPEKVAEVSIEQSTQTNTAQTEKVATGTELGTLEDDVLIEAINRSIQLDVSDIVKEEKEISDQKATKQKSDKESDSPRTENKEKNTTPSKFSDWLQVLDSGKTEEQKTEQKPEINDKESLKAPEDLINQFISLKTTRLKTPKEYKNTKYITLKKEEQKESFVTETLANVYASQGHFLKAIKIYEQLSLTIPEKNTFFASRIRFLREKMEYDN